MTEIVKLGELEPGTLFKKGDCYALKSEYRTEKGICESYIVGSGEMFYGGTGNPNALKVKPIDFDWLLKQAEENVRLREALEDVAAVWQDVEEPQLTQQEMFVRAKEALEVSK